MSKITEAMQKATQDRVGRLPTTNPSFSSDLHAFREELREEVRWAEEALSRSNTQPAAEMSSTSIGKTVLPHQGHGGDGSPGSAASGADGQANGAKLVEAAAASPASLEQAIELVTHTLEAHEQQAARVAKDQVRLKAQLTVSDQLFAEIEQERLGLQQRLAETATIASSLEAARALRLGQLEALRECQVLSHAVRVAEDELHANAVLLAQITHSQQRVAQELAHYQQQGASLRRRVDQSKERLGQALSAVGTLDQGVLEPVRAQ